MKIDISFVKAAITGREIEFLRYCGFSDKELSGKHQACPVCGGKDGYRTIITSRQRIPIGGFYCSRSSSQGTFFDNACHAKSKTPKETLELAKDFLGVDSMSKEDKYEADKRRKIVLELAERRAHAEKQSLIRDSETNYNIDDLCFLIKERGINKINGGERLSALLLAEQLKSTYNKRDEIDSKVSRWLSVNKEIIMNSKPTKSQIAEADYYINRYSRIKKERVIHEVCRELLYNKKNRIITDFQSHAACVINHLMEKYYGLLKMQQKT